MAQKKVLRALDYFGGVKEIQRCINRTLRGILLDRLGRSGSSNTYALAERRTGVNGLGMFLIGEDVDWKVQDIRIILDEFKLPYSIKDLLPVLSFKEEDSGYWIQLLHEKGFAPKNRTEQENIERFIYKTACAELSDFALEPR